MHRHRIRDPQFFICEEIHLEIFMQSESRELGLDRIIFGLFSDWNALATDIRKKEKRNEKDEKDDKLA